MPTILALKVKILRRSQRGGLKQGGNTLTSRLAPGFRSPFEGDAGAWSAASGKANERGALKWANLEPVQGPLSTEAWPTLSIVAAWSVLILGKVPKCALWAGCRTTRCSLSACRPR